MSALSKIEAAGFTVTLAGDNLEISPASNLIPSQVEFLKLHKQELIKQLSALQLQQDIREQIEERAAIMEYDGGLTRKEAGQATADAIHIYCYRVKDKPDSELVAIIPNTELDEAYRCLKLRYGDSLLAVHKRMNPLKGANP